MGCSSEKIYAAFCFSLDELLLPEESPEEDKPCKSEVTTNAQCTSKEAVVGGHAICPFLKEGIFLNQTMLTPTLQTHIKELRTYFFEKPASEHPGENPHCCVLERTIKAELRTWSDDKLKEFVDSLEGDEEELLFSVLCDLSNERPILKPKKWWFYPKMHQNISISNNKSFSVQSLDLSTSSL